MDFNHDKGDILVNNFSEVLCLKYPKSNDLTLSKVPHHSKSDSKTTEKKLSCLSDANIRLQPDDRRSSQSSISQSKSTLKFGIDAILSSESLHTSPKIHNKSELCFSPVDATKEARCSSFIQKSSSSLTSCTVRETYCHGNKTDVSKQKGLGTFQYKSLDLKMPFEASKVDLSPDKYPKSKDNQFGYDFMKTRSEVDCEKISRPQNTLMKVSDFYQGEDYHRKCVRNFNSKYKHEEFASNLKVKEFSNQPYYLKKGLYSPNISHRASQIDNWPLVCQRHLQNQFQAWQALALSYQPHFRKLILQPSLVDMSAACDMKDQTVEDGCSPNSSLHQPFMRNSNSSSIESSENDIKSNRKRRKWSRTVFSVTQRNELEKSFEVQKYVAKRERLTLANNLGLTDSQVRIWFQNRRMKWRQEQKCCIRKSSCKDTIRSCEDHQPSFLTKDLL